MYSVQSKHSNITDQQQQLMLLNTNSNANQNMKDQTLGEPSRKISENEVKKIKVIRSEEVNKMINQKLQLMKEFQKKYFDTGEVK